MTTLPLTDGMQKDIVERAVGLIARAAAPKGLLSTRDIAALTGFPPDGSVFRTMIADKSFPAPIYLGSREKRWYAGEVFHWIDRRRSSQM